MQIVCCSMCVCVFVHTECTLAGGECFLTIDLMGRKRSGSDMFCVCVCVCGMVYDIELMIASTAKPMGVVVRQPEEASLD